MLVRVHIRKQCACRRVCISSQWMTVMEMEFAVALARGTILSFTARLKFITPMETSVQKTSRLCLEKLPVTRVLVLPHPPLDQLPIRQARLQSPCNVSVNHPVAMLIWYSDSDIIFDFPLVETQPQKHQLPLRQRNVSTNLLTTSTLFNMLMRYISQLYSLPLSPLK